MNDMRCYMNPPEVPCTTSAFKASEFDIAEMEAVSAINKIALNSELMRTLLAERRETGEIDADCD